MALGRRQARSALTLAGGSILVLNVGSSTIKFGFFAAQGRDDPLSHGVLEHSGAASAVGELLRSLAQNPHFARVRSVGHRLVHGGLEFRRPVRIDGAVRASLEKVVALAPGHLPSELHAIDEVARLHPSLVQVACFDTAFHGRLPPVARIFGIPRELAETGIVRYGFHGLSYEYLTETLRERGQLPARTIIAHLGNGASIAAILDGISIDTSMGMTPTGGLVMSTRSGDIDPGVLLYLMRSRGFSLSQLDEVVDRRGGLLGVSQSSGDVRKLLAAEPSDANAREALDLFCYQARKFVGAYAAALGGLDALIFTGGIGEHSAELRSRICEKLEFLGVRIDQRSNLANDKLISTADSRVTVRVLETREDVMIARHVRGLLAQPTQA